mmetsp:Transcript_9064/g.21671  ORF Transcript_9064/g.21671 Transcript_9064/m.21671 type:complete len:285 (+) Transcript_9064:693-1547(+)
MGLGHVVCLLLGLRRRAHSCRSGNNGRTSRNRPWHHPRHGHGHFGGLCVVLPFHLGLISLGVLHLSLGDLLLQSCHASLQAVGATPLLDNRPLRLLQRSGNRQAPNLGSFLFLSFLPHTKFHVLNLLCFSCCLPLSQSNLVLSLGDLLLFGLHRHCTSGLNRLILDCRLTDSLRKFSLGLAGFSTCLLQLLCNGLFLTLLRLVLAFKLGQLGRDSILVLLELFLSSNIIPLLLFLLVKLLLQLLCPLPLSLRHALRLSCSFSSFVKLQSRLLPGGGSFFCVLLR